MKKIKQTRRPRATYALVLAAGLGKRMFSRTVKLLHPVCGRPMLLHVLDALAELPIRKRFVIVGNQRREVEACARTHRSKSEFVWQRRQLGTGHAVLQVRKHLDGKRGDLLICNGDLPTLSGDTLGAFLAFHRDAGAGASILSTTAADPTGYGRIVRNLSGDVARIVEQADASAEEARINEINSGTYIVDLTLLFPALRRLSAANRQKEYYLTDIVEILRQRGERIGAFRHPDRDEVLGVNHRGELARAARVLWRRKAEELMRSGVSLLDPDTAYIDTGVRVGTDSLIYPGTVLEGSTTVGRGCTIGPGCHLIDTTLGDGAEVLGYSRLQESSVGAGARVGPFAHLRPGSVLREGARVGNFVETKQAVLGKGAKANHHAYLGDAKIGRGANIGAGTITCNYDGTAKHRTTIGDDVFIGSDTQLVAPVRIGRGAYIGAGSTITSDVPAYSLAISRGRQRIKKNWARDRAATGNRKRGSTGRRKG